VFEDGIGGAGAGVAEVRVTEPDVGAGDPGTGTAEPGAGPGQETPTSRYQARLRQVIAEKNAAVGASTALQQRLERLETDWSAYQKRVRGDEPPQADPNEERFAALEESHQALLGDRVVNQAAAWARETFSDAPAIGPEVIRSFMSEHGIENPFVAAQALMAGHYRGEAGTLRKERDELQKKIKGAQDKAAVTAAAQAPGLSGAPGTSGAAGGKAPNRKDARKGLADGLEAFLSVPKKQGG